MLALLLPQDWIQNQHKASLSKTCHSDNKQILNLLILSRIHSLKSHKFEWVGFQLDHSLVRWGEPKAPAQNGMLSKSTSESNP